MRKIHTTGLALFGVVLAIASFGFAIAADEPQPELVQRAFLPGVAGDDSKIVLGQTTPTATPIPFGCAGLRSDIKLLVDPAAGFDLLTTQSTTVNTLLFTARPDDISNTTARIEPFEARVVEFDASLIGYRRVNGGGIELAIAQTTGGSPMVASFPGSACLVDTPVEIGGQISAARIALQQACGNPPQNGSFKPLGGTAHFTGVPFWGPQHDGTQGSPNGIELGPVLSFEFSDATSCDANASKTPFPTKTPTAVLETIGINLFPQVGNAGTEIKVTIMTQPLVIGLSCYYMAYDAATNLISQGEMKLTGVDGTASWFFTIPDGAVPNNTTDAAKVTPLCNGITPKGSARLYIQP